MGINALCCNLFVQNEVINLQSKFFTPRNFLLLFYPITLREITRIRNNFEFSLACCAENALDLHTHTLIPKLRTFTPF